MRDFSATQNASNIIPVTTSHITPS
jgi:hypothetical protein